MERTSIERRSRASCALLATFAMLFCGCEDEAAKPDTKAPVGDAGKVAPETNVAENKAALDPPPIMAETPPAKIVEVQLAERDAATCLIKQGDTFPPATLKTLAGEEQAIAETFGSTASVVLFWSPENEYSVQWLEDLLLDTAGKQPGVNVTVICVGDSTQAAVDKVASIAATLPTGFASLSDADRALYGQVSSGELPRLFLLDADGKVLWFCIDYSVASYDEFESALTFVLDGISEDGA